MKLTRLEIFGLNEWIRKKELTVREVADTIGGTKHTAVVRWRQGGGIAPSRHTKLAVEIAPYIHSDYLGERLLLVKAEIEGISEQYEKAQTNAGFARHRLAVGPEREHREHKLTLRKAEGDIPRLKAKVEQLYDVSNLLHSLLADISGSKPREPPKTDKEKLGELAAENFKLKEELRDLKGKLAKLDALQKLVEDFKSVFGLGKS